MKTAAGTIGILSGIFGVIGGFLQVGFGGDTNAFWLSWLIIILSSIVLAKPKLPGFILIILGGATFYYGNYFSAPFAIVAGIIALLSPSKQVEN